MSEWFCEILGEQLGPMPWKELVYLAERGNLRGDHRVRQGTHGDWGPAGEVAGLPVADVGQRPERGALADEPEAFELGTADREGLFQQLVATPAASGWVAASPEEREPRASVAPEIAKDVADLATNHYGTLPDSAEQISSADDVRSAAVALAPPPARSGRAAPMSTRSPAASTIVRSAKPPVPRRIAPHADVEGLSRLAKPLIIASAVVGVAVAGWFVWNKRTGMGPSYHDVLRGYELRHHELAGVRQSRPDARSSQVFAARFKIGVASLRQRIAATDTNPIGNDLRRAGTLLDSMSATAFSIAGSEGEAEYLQQERQLRDIFSSAKASLGVTTK